VAAGIAAEQGVRTVGVDFSAEMVRLAQTFHVGLRFELGDAEALDFPDGAFDGVVMGFGLLHLARPDQAIAEAARVLRVGGRFACTVWAPPAEAIGFKLVLDAVAAAGNPNVPLPPGPPFFRFSDAAECERVLAASGFVDCEVTRLPLEWRLGSVDAL